MLPFQGGAKNMLHNTLWCRFFEQDTDVTVFIVGWASGFGTEGDGCIGLAHGRDLEATQKPPTPRTARSAHDMTWGEAS